MQRSVDLETKLLSRNFSKKKNRTQDTILLFWLFFGRSYGSTILFQDSLTLVSVKSTVKILPFLVAFVENTNFKELMKVEELLEQMLMVQLELVELVDFP